MPDGNLEEHPLPPLPEALDDALLFLHLNCDEDEDVLVVTKYIERVCTALLASSDILADPGTCSQLVEVLQKIQACNMKSMQFEKLCKSGAAKAGEPVMQSRMLWSSLLRNTAKRPALRSRDSRNKDVLAMACRLPQGATFILETWRHDVDAIVDGFEEVANGSSKLRRVRTLANAQDKAC